MNARALTILALLAALLAGCGPGHRTVVRVVDGVPRDTRFVSPSAYHYYARARIALERGLLDEARAWLTPAGGDVLEAREGQRQAMTERLVRHQAETSGLEPGMDFKAAIAASTESRMWEDFAADCVECGACNFACCTCHCFLLADGTDSGNDPVRGKQWDSCLLMNFARVAGGANPRRWRSTRLRNRFQKKFNYFPDILDTYACDGCGRCTEVCTGNIDIRAVLKRAVDENESLPADPGDD